MNNLKKGLDPVLEEMRRYIEFKNPAHTSKIRYWLEILENAKVRPDEIKWVVNNLGELGVEVRGTVVFLYKGGSMQYGGDLDVRYRRIDKHEFGEVVYPESWVKGCDPGGYRVNVVDAEGDPEYQWRDIPAINGSSCTVGDEARTESLYGFKACVREIFEPMEDAARDAAGLHERIADLEAYKESNAALRHENKRLNERIEELRADNERIAELESENKRIGEALTERTKQRDYARNECQSWMDVQGDLASRNAALGQENKALRERIEELRADNERIAELEDKVRNRERKIDDLRRQRDKARADRDELKRRVGRENDLASRIVYLEAMLANCDADNEEIQKERNEAMAETVTLRDELTKTRKQVEELSLDYDQMRCANKFLREDLDDEQRMHRSAAESHDALLHDRPQWGEPTKFGDYWAQWRGLMLCVTEKDRQWHPGIGSGSYWPRAWRATRWTRWRRKH